eukprot:jgi/Psemu1/249655/estExt_Genewise1Plus.C_70014
MGLSKAARQSRGPTVSYFSTKWSGNLSFASPEADFFTVSNFSSDLTNTTWSRNLSFSAPESDFVSASPKIHLGTSASTVSCLSSNQTNASWSESLSFATPESDYVSAPKEECLPTTIEDALNDERPVIITNIESPFLVVDVNGAWEGLCGYHRDEAIGRNIGSLLQGPETDIETADNAIRSLRENGFSEAVLTNYTKNGRKFKNHLKIGMIPAAGNIHDSSSSDDSYFVGVLYDMDRQINEKPEKTVSL